MIKRFKKGLWLAVDLKINKVERFDTEEECDYYIEHGYIRLEEPVIVEEPEIHTFTEETFDFGEDYELD